MSILNKTVSYFPSITATTQGVEVNLLALLQSNKHKEMILRLRQSDETMQKQLKEKLPCYTVAGTFSRRCDDGLILPSGLAAVDLDSAENYDAIYLLNELKKIDCIAYAGLSCRGKRLFCIVPFKYPDKYVKHYERLIKSFIDLGLPMGDDCHKRISQPRFVSWNDDSTQFFNHNAKPYYLLPAEKTYFNIRNHDYSGVGAVPDNAFQWCMEQINKSYSFSKGARHDYIIRLARYCNMKGLPESETMQGCIGFTQTDFSETEIKNIVRHIYTTQYESHAKLPFKKKEQHQQQTFEQPQQAVIAKVQKLQTFPEKNIGISKETYFFSKSKIKSEDWGAEIKELEHFFETATLPPVPIKLNSYSTIIDIHLFINSNLNYVKANNGNPTYLTYLKELQELKEYLIKNKN